jgi:hypothetical protein
VAFGSAARGPKFSHPARGLSRGRKRALHRRAAARRAPRRTCGNIYHLGPEDMIVTRFTEILSSIGRRVEVGPAWPGPAGVQLLEGAHRGGREVAWARAWRRCGPDARIPGRGWPRRPSRIRHGAGGWVDGTCRPSVAAVAPSASPARPYDPMRHPLSPAKNRPRWSGCSWWRQRQRRLRELTCAAGCSSTPNSASTCSGARRGADLPGRAEQHRGGGRAGHLGPVRHRGPAGGRSRCRSSRGGDTGHDQVRYLAGELVGQRRWPRSRRWWAQTQVEHHVNRCPRKDLAAVDGPPTRTVLLARSGARTPPPRGGQGGRAPRATSPASIHLPGRVTDRSTCAARRQVAPKVPVSGPVAGRTRPGGVGARRAEPSGGTPWPYPPARAPPPPSTSCRAALGQQFRRRDRMARSASPRGLPRLPGRKPGRRLTSVPLTPVGGIRAVHEVAAYAKKRDVAYRKGELARDAFCQGAPSPAIGFFARPASLAAGPLAGG